MAKLGRAVCALGVLTVLSVGSLAGQAPPRVLVIATGGTIASRPGAEQLTGDALVQAVPALAEVARVEVEEFSRIGSSSMTPDHWLRLSRRIDEVLREDADLAGIVVTHGTDTMEETAYFLHLTVAHERPIVVTGSMRSATAVSADGPANLLTAVKVAVSREAGGRGVLVVLDDVIHSARDVRKTDNNRVGTFRSMEWGALGVVELDGVHFRRRQEGLHTTTSQVGLRVRVSQLPNVPIVSDYAGTDGVELTRWIEQGVDGVVVQAFGGGRASPGMRAAMAAAVEQGVPILITSRVPEGRVLRSNAWGEAGLLSADDLPAHKARVFLMLALGVTRDVHELQNLLDRH